MAPATPSDYNLLMLLQKLNNQQQQQLLSQCTPPNISSALNTAATLAMLAQHQQRATQPLQSAETNATESLLMLAVHQLQQQQQNQQQQQQQAQKCFSQWRQQFSSKINNNNNNEIEQKPTFLSSPYQSDHHHHAPLQHSLSASTVLVHSQDSASGYGGGDASPPLAPAASTPLSAGDASQLLFSATTSDCGGGAETPKTSTTAGSDEKPKRRSRLGGTSLKTAKVWRFFTQLPHPEQAATCQLCGKIIKATNSSTTGMIRHLRSCHPAEHKIVEDERRITLVQKTLKNVTCDAERAQLMQSYNAMAAASGGTPSADAMSSLLSQLSGTPSSPSASGATRPPPTTPLSSLTAFRHYGQTNDLKLASSDTTSSTTPLMDGQFGDRYLRQMMKLLTKTQEQPSAFSLSPSACFENFKASLAQQQQLATQLNNNDENNNKSVVQKPNDSGIGVHNDSEEDDDAPARRVQPAASTISPQIGATAITTLTKARSGNDATHFGSTAATAEDFTDAAAAAGAQTTTALVERQREEDSDALHNDSTFSPVHEHNEDEQRGNDEDGDEEEEECTKDNETEVLVKPSPIFMHGLSCISAGLTPPQRGVKRSFAASSLKWTLPETATGGWTAQQAKQLNEQIALMLLVDNAPVSIVERVGFRELIRSLCPQHMMPSVETFQREIIPTLPERLGCDFATFRERLQHNNPLISGDLLGDLLTDYSSASHTAGKLSPPVDMSESGFQDCEDIENHFPSPPQEHQKLSTVGGPLTMLSTQSLYAFDAKRARGYSSVKTEPEEATSVDVKADDSVLSSLSGACSPTTTAAATDSNNNVDAALSA